MKQANPFSDKDTSGIIVIFKEQESSEIAAAIAQNLTANQMAVLSAYFRMQSDMMLMAEEQRKIEASMQVNTPRQDILRPS